MPYIPDRSEASANDRYSTTLGFASQVIGWLVLGLSFFTPVSDATRIAISQAVIGQSIGGGILARSNKFTNSSQNPDPNP
jgi:hypothetical protein